MRSFPMKQRGISRRISRQSGNGISFLTGETCTEFPSNILRENKCRHKSLFKISYIQRRRFAIVTDVARIIRRACTSRVSWRVTKVWASGKLSLIIAHIRDISTEAFPVLSSTAIPRGQPSLWNVVRKESNSRPAQNWHQVGLGR